MDELVAWLRGVLDIDEWSAAKTGEMHDWVLADIAAKRAILDEFESDDWTHTPDYWVGLGYAVRQLGAAYADRPGYLEQWRPAT